MTSWPETRISLIGRLADPADLKAWQDFESCYQSAIYRYAKSRGLQADEAMDVVQEVMLAVHRAATRWEASNRTGSFRAWLSETARRITLQSIRFRDRIGRGAGFDADQPTIEQVPESMSGDEASEERQWAFYSAVASVEKETNPTLWKAFWMTSIEGQHAHIVAQRLGMRVGTVYSAKSRVLARIRQCIESGDSRNSVHSAGPAEPLSKSSSFPGGKS